MPFVTIDFERNDANINPLGLSETLATMSINHADGENHLKILTVC